MAISLTVDDVIDALATFMEPLVDGAQIVRAQVNRVPMPDAPCIVLTELLTVDLSVPYADYIPPSAPIPALGVAALHGPSRIDVQADFYGATAGELCQSVRTAFRTGWGFDTFPQEIKPLYTSDGVQMPLITGEQQYQSRWTLTASMQYNPVVTVPQDFAETLEVTALVAVDVNL